MMGLGVSRSGATIGTKSPCAPPARADSIKPKVDAVGVKANGKDKADKRAATGAPTKVVPGAGKELLQSEQGVERTETVAAVRVGSASRMESPLRWPAAMGDRSGTLV